MPRTGSTTRWNAIRVASTLVALALAIPVMAEEPFYYYRDGDEVVITNTPSRPEAQRIRSKTRPAPIRSARGINLRITKVLSSRLPGFTPT